MRRWFIIVFTLHFFFSVGAFAFGHIDIHAPDDDDTKTLTALAGDGQDPTQKDDLLGSAPDHGLTDSQPELPEFITHDVRPLVTAPPHPVPADLRWAPPRSPTLEGLQRPPRVHGIRA